jgi:hypothetical protein
MATTFISPDFTNRPYAPALNTPARQNAQQPMQQPVEQLAAPVAPKGGFTDFVKDNKIMIIIFVLVVVIIICVLIWMMTRGKPKPIINQDAPGPPQGLPRGPAQGQPPGQPRGPPQQGPPQPPQQGPPPQQPPPQPIPEMQSQGIETADDKELNKFMHLDESSMSDSFDSEEEKRESFDISDSDDESDRDNIGNSWSVESSDE